MTWINAVTWGCYVLALVLFLIIGLVATVVCWHKGLKKLSVFVALYFLTIIFLIPVPAHAMEIVTCERAAGLMSDLASARDHGMEEAEGRRMLYAWIRYYHVSDIQGARLRYDMHGLFSDYVLRHASPDEIRSATLRNCPREYAP